MINDISCRALSFFRYFSPAPSRAAGTTHSHSIGLVSTYVLILGYKFTVDQSKVPMTRPSQLVAYESMNQELKPTETGRPNRLAQVF